MSATSSVAEPLSGPPSSTPALGIPSRSRPAQPAPHRPVPVAPSTEAGSPTITPTPEASPDWPPAQRVLAPGWLGRMKSRAGGASGDDLGESTAGSGPSRTTSSRDRDRRPGVSIEILAKTIGSLLALVAGAAAWAAHKGGRELREPDASERAKVAEPVARILDRHIGTAWLNDDLLDLTEIGAGLSAYAQTRPLQGEKRDPDAETLPDLPDGYEEP